MWEPPKESGDRTPWSKPVSESKPNDPESEASERKPFSLSEQPSAPKTSGQAPPPVPMPSASTPPAALQSRTPNQGPGPLGLGVPLSASGPNPSAPRVDAPSQEPKKSRTGFMVTLAAFTIAASGLLSWAIASSDDDATPVFQTQSSLVQQPTSQTEFDGPTSAALIGDEPIAAAAAKIAPSVVQLNLNQGLGTGIIVDANGTILTAAHVVGDFDEVRVTFSDGSSTEGTVVGTDEATDVAVVQVDPGGRELVPAPLANGSDVIVGQFAIAVGSPFGFDQTVTAGIISAVDRVVNTVSMVQTDAPINPGNSGGPLINLDGEVVGINDLIFTQSGTSAGVGFAISIDLAVIVADQILAGEEVSLAQLGVSTNVPTNGSAGARVAQVSEGSAAEAAGLQVGDIITGIDETPVRGTAELRAQIINRSPGTEVTLSAIRGGESIQLDVTLGSTRDGS